MASGKFQGQGINYNAKMIGMEEVGAARGEQMCQNVITHLKQSIASGEHKHKVIVNISLDGVRLVDLKTNQVIHDHAVNKISFIARDLTDSRAFAYIYGPGDGTHQLYALKTEKAADALVLTLRDLFQVVYEMKKMESAARRESLDGMRVMALSTSTDFSQLTSPADIIQDTGKSDTSSHHSVSSDSSWEGFPSSSRLTPSAITRPQTLPPVPLSVPPASTDKTSSVISRPRPRVSSSTSSGHISAILESPAEGVDFSASVRGQALLSPSNNGSVIAGGSSSHSGLPATSESLTEVTARASQSQPALLSQPRLADSWASFDSPKKTPQVTLPSTDTERVAGISWNTTPKASGATTDLTAFDNAGKDPFADLLSHAYNKTAASSSLITIPGVSASTAFGDTVATAEQGGDKLQPGNGGERAEGELTDSGVSYAPPSCPPPLVPAQTSAAPPPPPPRRPTSALGGAVKSTATVPPPLPPSRPSTTLASPVDLEHKPPPPPPPRPRAMTPQGTASLEKFSDLTLTLPTVRSLDQAPAVPALMNSYPPAVSGSGAPPASMLLTASAKLRELTALRLNAEKTAPGPLVAKHATDSRELNLFDGAFPDKTADLLTPVTPQANTNTSVTDIANIPFAIPLGGKTGQSGDTVRARPRPQTSLGCLTTTSLQQRDSADADVARSASVLDDVTRPRSGSAQNKIVVEDPFILADPFGSVYETAFDPFGVDSSDTVSGFVNSCEWVSDVNLESVGWSKCPLNGHTSKSSSSATGINWSAASNSATGINWSTTAPPSSGGINWSTAPKNDGINWSAQLSSDKQSVLVDSHSANGSKLESSEWSGVLHTAPVKMSGASWQSFDNSLI